MRKLLLFFTLLIPSLVYGQGTSVYNIAAYNSSGTLKVVPSAVITVCVAADAGTPCTNKVSIFSDVALTLPLGNPFNADVNGNYQYFAASGTSYTETVTGIGFLGFSHQVGGGVVAGACPTCVVAVAPGAGVAHFAGGTQTVTSSKVVSADMNITPTSCTNQFITAIGATGIGTCTTDTLASAQHANQGTTTTLLHGNAAGNPTFGSVVTADIAANAVGSGQLNANIVKRDFGTTFGDTTGSVLTSGSVVYFTVPYACTIAAWNASVDAGTVTFDVWKIATGTAIPTAGNTITAAALPAISSGTAIHSTTLTAWTTSVAANDIIGIQLKTVATAKYAELDIQCNQ